jgi:hypothetical protein
VEVNHQTSQKYSRDKYGIVGRRCGGSKTRPCSWSFAYRPGRRRTLGSQVTEEGSECFESLMLRQAQQNGKSSTISKAPPFVLSFVEGLRESFFRILLDRTPGVLRLHLSEQFEISSYFPEYCGFFL